MNNQSVPNVMVPANVLTDVVNYIAKRPLHEVLSLYNGLMQAVNEHNKQHSQQHEQEKEEGN